MAAPNIQPPNVMTVINANLDLLNARINGLFDRMENMSSRVEQVTERVQACDVMLRAESGAITANRNLIEQVESKLKDIQLALDKQAARIQAQSKVNDTRFTQIDNKLADLGDAESDSAMESDVDVDANSMDTGSVGQMGLFRSLRY